MAAMSTDLIQWVYDKFRNVGYYHDPAIRGTAKELETTIDAVATVVGKYGTL